MGFLRHYWGNPKRCLDKIQQRSLCIDLDTTDFPDSLVKVTWVCHKVTACGRFILAVTIPCLKVNRFH